MVLRFGLGSLGEISTRAGRKYARLKDGEEVVGMFVVGGSETVIIASASGRVILFSAREVNFLSGVGRGVLGVKLAAGDRVLAAAVSRAKKEGLRVFTTGGRKIDVTPRSYRVASRGGKGVEVIKRGGLTRAEPPPIVLPDLGDGLN
jgi:DNA gyrase subunit A